MNYYNRHIGDYAKDTAHLTLAEDGAYGRMLDLYYDSEQPLPLDLDVLCRKLRCRAKSERAIVDALLIEFFRKEADGWHKKRCDEEIDKYQKKAEKNRLNGTQGGRPKKPKDNPEITQMVSKQNPNETLASSQKPVASSQEPETYVKNGNALSGKPDVTSLNGFNSQAREILQFLNEKTGRRYEPVPSNLRIISARLKEGATVAQCRQVIAKKVREWSGNEKMDEFIRPKTLFGAMNFAQYQGELVTPQEGNHDLP